tara:strand:- start:109 stop:321 length:213 start_codon:yes stop_codon:yes gene_type:complete
MGILDLEPTYREIQKACHLRYGNRYAELSWEQVLYNNNNPARTDMEHAVEIELIQKKRLHAETEDAIVSV